jgi:hypothetical protein
MRMRRLEAVDTANHDDRIGSPMRLAPSKGGVNGEQVNLFLYVLWRYHEPNYVDSIIRTEAEFQVARGWRNALTKQQKEKIRTSQMHLWAKDADAFIKIIESRDYTNEDREIDLDRYRVTQSHLSFYV